MIIIFIKKNKRFIYNKLNMAEKTETQKMLQELDNMLKLLNVDKDSKLIKN